MSYSIKNVLIFLKFISSLLILRVFTENVFKIRIWYLILSNNLSHDYYKIEKKN